MAGDVPSPSPGPGNGGDSAGPVSPAGSGSPRGTGAPAAPLALYRRYRPATFAEVKGQDHVTEPLRQALRSGRVHHAYLFSGPRGCGKTSSARILARSLNCESGPTPDPCGICASCVALAPAGPGSIDVIEIDAASHGGVDDARDLRERAFYAPVAARFKIYIIDEAHMVTREGFNALLKLVEEPPPHLKFVFATTEPEKVISTIRSRTHHYPFRLVPPAVLRELLEKILASESVAYEAAVLPVVIRAGAGSVRDSLSVLDQLIAGSDDSGLRYDRATALLGYTDDSLLDEVTEAFAAGQGAAVFGAIDRVVEGGHDPRRFAADLLDRLRDLIVLAAVPDAGATGLLDVPADRLERMREQAGRFGQAHLVAAAETISTGLVEMRGATSPRLQLELMCAQVLLPAPGSGERSMLARLERVERQLADSGPASASGRSPQAVRAAAAQQAGAAPAAGLVPDVVPVKPAAPEPAIHLAGGSPAAAGSGVAPDGAPDGAPDARHGMAADGDGADGGPAGHAAAASPAAAPGAVPAGRSRAADDASQEDAGPDDATPDDGTDAAGNHGRAALPGAVTRGTGADAGMLRDRWADVLDAVKNQRRVAWILLGSARVETLADNVLTLRFDREGEAKGFSASGYDRDLTQVLQAMFGITPQVRTVFGPGQAGGGRVRTDSRPGPGGIEGPELAGAGHSPGSTELRPAGIEQPGGPDGPPATVPQDLHGGVQLAEGHDGAAERAADAGAGQEQQPGGEARSAAVNQQLAVAQPGAPEGGLTPPAGSGHAQRPAPSRQTAPDTAREMAVSAAGSVASLPAGTFSVGGPPWDAHPDDDEAAEADVLTGTELIARELGGRIIEEPGGA